MRSRHDASTRQSMRSGILQRAGQVAKRQVVLNARRSSEIGDALAVALRPHEKWSAAARARGSNAPPHDQRVLQRCARGLKVNGRRWGEARKRLTHGAQW